MSCKNKNFGQIQLQSVAVLIMGQSPPGSTYNELGQGLPFFQGVKDFDYRYPTPRVYCTAPTRIAKQGDILFSVRAPIGRVNVADRLCAAGRGIAIIRPKEQSDIRYIEYLLRYMEPTWNVMEASGSVFGNATKKDILTLPLIWPHQHTREKISNVLRAFDDKIELNRRMNETLEEIARALFKSWFVDFDPVRAKMDGRWQPGRSLPGLPAELYDHFPDRLVPSELGKIPEGWILKGLDEIADFVNGLALQRFPAEGDNYIPVIKIAEMRRGYTATTGRASPDIGEKYTVEDGDLLFSWSGSLEVTLWSHGRGALNQHLFKVTSAYFPRWFYWGWIHEHLDEFRWIAASKATTMGHIQRHHLREAKVVVPTDMLIKQTDLLINPLLKAIITNEVTNRELTKLRDTLLPKLLSGEVRVGDSDTS